MPRNPDRSICAKPALAVSVLLLFGSLPEETNHLWNLEPTVIPGYSGSRMTIT